MSEEQKPGEVPFAVAASVVKSQYEKTTSIRVSVEDLVSMGLEVRHLREQVDVLQATGTAQISASRDACFEVAARKCEEYAARIPENKQAQIYCTECAETIRTLISKPSG